MRIARAALVLTLASAAAVAPACKRPPAPPQDSSRAPAAHDGGGHDLGPHEPAPARPDAAPVPDLAPTGDAAPAVPTGGRSLRVYIAGESIERWNRFTAAPFSASGEVARPGDNSDDEYGWLVPFADRLHRRAPDLTVAWVGTDAWTDYDDQPYDGRYPSRSAPASSSIPGSSIDSWLEARRGELTARKHCYDVAIAARGGNDFGLDNDADVEASLAQLLELLGRGSSCRKHPLVYVTGHLPDEQRSQGTGPDDGTYVAQQRHRYVERLRAAADAAHVGFIDMWTPFLENRATTGFPKPAWTRGKVPDFARIGRTNDRMHPRRLASIYAGELVADALDLAALRAPP